MAPASDPLAELSRMLAEDGGLKVWSVIVTALGDLAQGDPKAEMPGPVLTRLLARLGIQPEAIRVALHRLRRDGWIDSRKAGRTGYLRLSATGRAQTARVADRVFGAAPVAPSGLVLAIAPQAGDGSAATLLEAGEALSLGRGAMILTAPAPDLPDDWMVFDATLAQPGWVTDLLAREAGEAQFARLSNALQPLRSLPGSIPDGEAAALRLMTLHGWRRLVLRANPVAEALIGPAAQSVRCRAVVADLLQRYPRPAPGVLETDEAWP
ncbi:hypothetical protein KUH32_02010 [Thalassococcus sp. CAU 1522]|uniref:Transcriptional repressor PaaX-like N-terminal domain-containing protein n=1 Tax=Thalassococcus arenae TaxID=2851652 RepID=A0ABS6N3E6_9RHOB|nr:hypothetical protein [Thalassococcus arenae]MBV2358538.1 hypothetical protein [Thalassococcus arenae]